MSQYQLELARLRPYDEIQDVENIQGYDFIETASHGYLVVPTTDNNYKIALSICKYGYKGNLAVYLEEDCEAREFLNNVTAGVQ